jgi:gliding motility-associated-like protein
MIIVVNNEPIYYIPNTFTPDGDLYNENFKPVFSAGIDIYQYKLLIYNRWGEIIFESNNPEVGWDGTYGGVLVNQGMYIYQISYKELTKDKRGVVNGHFNLLR